MGLMLMTETVAKGYIQIAIAVSAMVETVVYQFSGEFVPRAPDKYILCACLMVVLLYLDMILWMRRSCLHPISSGMRGFLLTNV